MPFKIKNLPQKYTLLSFMTESTISNIRAWRCRKDIFTKYDSVTYLIYERMAKVYVEQPLALPGSANYTKVILIFKKINKNINVNPPKKILFF